MPKAVKLIEEGDSWTYSSHEIVDGLKAESKSLLTIILIEEDNHFSNISRLILALNSVQSLYEISAKLENMPDEQLSVVACDAGSDKSFDFVGAVAAVERMKDIIASIWSNAIYHQEGKNQKKIENIAKSLPVLNNIKELETAENITKEEAELLRRKTIEAATGFLESGLMTPEIDQHSTFSPRELLKPAPKLLSPPLAKSGTEAVADTLGSTKTGSDSNGKSLFSDNLSSDDIAKLKQILEQSRKDKGDPDSD